LIPAGTVHALGAGITVYEIQQPSNTTYRLDDWGRVDTSGTARALHHEDGMAVVDPDSRPGPIPPISIAAGDARRDLLVATRYFALERMTLAQNVGVTLDPVDSPQVLTVIHGNAILDSSGWEASLSLGETVVVPAQRTVTVRGSNHAVGLRGWVPDLERDVIAPARAAGATDAAIDHVVFSRDGRRP
nr:mannose-6-phosphate isomerase [Chloroflexia bacterium]